MHINQKLSKIFIIWACLVGISAEQNLYASSSSADLAIQDINKLYRSASWTSSPSSPIQIGEFLEKWSKVYEHPNASKEQLDASIEKMNNIITQHIKAKELQESQKYDGGDRRGEINPPIQLAEILQNISSNSQSRANIIGYLRDSKTRKISLSNVVYFSQKRYSAEDLTYLYFYIEQNTLLNIKNLGADTLRDIDKRK